MGVTYREKGMASIVRRWPRVAGIVRTRFGITFAMQAV